MFQIEVDVVESPLEELRAASGFEASWAGARLLFEGTIREENLKKKVIGIEFEAHPTLAVRALQAICEEAAKKIKGRYSIRMLHRVGRVAVGEMSVFIDVKAEHREDAFETCRFLIEALKKKVPIWKNEVYQDGSNSWLKGTGLAAKLTEQELGR